MSKDTSSPTKPISALDDYVLLDPSGLRVSPLCLGALAKIMTLIIGNSLIFNLISMMICFDLTYEKTFGETWVETSLTPLAIITWVNPFIGLQTRYNLLERTMETDLQLACAGHGVGIIPWGFLPENINSEATSEFRNRFIAEHSISEKNWKILDEVKAISEEIGRTPIQVTLNWTMQKPGITSPLI
ncbi:5739_t:CDS:2, partial [Rhizophagus irregularis]